MDRNAVFSALREAGISVNVHYIPVHLHPFYRNHFGTRGGLCPVAEKAYEEIISIPMYSSLKRAEQDYVIETVRGIL
jgi:perosamine synthetase